MCCWARAWFLVSGWLSGSTRYPFISGYLSSYLSLQPPLVRWAQGARSRSSQTSVPTTDPSRLAGARARAASSAGTARLAGALAGSPRRSLPAACLPNAWLPENRRGKTTLRLSSASWVTLRQVSVFRGPGSVCGWLLLLLGLLRAVETVIFAVLCVGL